MEEFKLILCWTPWGENNLNDTTLKAPLVYRFNNCVHQVSSVYEVLLISEGETSHKTLLADIFKWIDGGLIINITKYHKEGRKLYCLTSAPTWTMTCSLSWLWHASQPNNNSTVLLPVSWRAMDLLLAIWWWSARSDCEVTNVTNISSDWQ